MVKLIWEKIKMVNNLPKNVKFFTEIVKSNFVRLKFPYKLTFALTYKCNLRCKTCFIWKKEPRDELTIDEIEKFFRKSNRFYWIDLTGGEIFSRSDLSAVGKIILNHCRFLRILHFPTNGQLPDEIISLAKEIKKHRRRVSLVVTVGLDGVQEINDAIKGKRGAWLKSLETFVKLKQLGLKHVYIGYTISEYNQGRLKDTILAIKKSYPAINYADIHINIFQKSKHYFDNVDAKDLIVNDAVEKDLKEYLRYRNNGIKSLLERKFISLVPGYASSGKMVVSCQALSATCFIDPYGDIYPCIILSKKLSNVKNINYNLNDFWNSSETMTMRREILSKKCTGCWTPCEAYPALLGSFLRVPIQLRLFKIGKQMITRQK